MDDLGQRPERRLLDRTSGEEIQADGEIAADWGERAASLGRTILTPRPTSYVYRAPRRAFRGTALTLPRVRTPFGLVVEALLDS